MSAIYKIGEKVPAEWVITDDLLRGLPQEDQDALKKVKEFTITGQSKKGKTVELESEDGSRFVYVSSESLSYHYRKAFINAFYSSNGFTGYN